jgi:hypothetical protein
MNAKSKAGEMGAKIKSYSDIKSLQDHGSESFDYPHILQCNPVNFTGTLVKIECIATP